MMRHPRSPGMTLVELIVAMAIIGTLIGLLLPAVSYSREIARSIHCRNNLRQLALAVQSYDVQFGVMPPSFVMDTGVVQRGAWSIHARIAPFLEQRNTVREIDLSRDWHAQQHTGVPANAFPGIVCPSDPGGIVRIRDGAPYVHTTSYGFNYGTWFIYDPRTNRAGDGAFRVNRVTPSSHVVDGMSQTLCVAEVKAGTAYLRNATPSSYDTPTSANAFYGLNGDRKMSPTGEKNTGHTVWCDGRVHHTGFTTTFTPNTYVAYEYDGTTYDIDFNSQQEGRDLQNPTYAAVTARSFHSDVIYAAFLDGSVRSIHDGIDLHVWRALGTRGGND